MCNAAVDRKKRKIWKRQEFDSEEVDLVEYNAILYL